MTPPRPQLLELRRADGFRVRLDRHFRVTGQAEGRADPGEHPAELAPGRAASGCRRRRTPCSPAFCPLAERPGGEVDLARYQLRVGGLAAAAAQLGRGVGVEVAVAAAGPAERARVRTRRTGLAESPGSRSAAALPSAGTGSPSGSVPGMLPRISCSRENSGREVLVTSDPGTWFRRFSAAARQRPAVGPTGCPSRPAARSPSAGSRLSRTASRPGRPFRTRRRCLATGRRRTGRPRTGRGAVHARAVRRIRGCRGRRAPPSRGCSPRRPTGTGRSTC